MKSFSKTVYKVFVLTLIVFIFSSCAYKVPLKDPYSVLREEGFSGKWVKGKIFLQGESFFLKENFRGGAYGNFIASQDFLYLFLRPPFTSEILIIWQRGEDFLRMVNFEKKKIYRIFLEGLGKVDLSHYFLGLKEESVEIKRGLLEGEYQFSLSEKEGKLISSLLSLTWKIKEMEFSSEAPKIPEFQGFKEKEVRISF